MSLRRQATLPKMLGFAWLTVAVFVLLCAGCDEEPPFAADLETVWGRRGVADGRLQKPRAIAIDDHDRLYLVDMTARIQVFTTDGQYLHGWQTPVHVNGRPVGLGIDRSGRVVVADTHYFRVLFYSPRGQLLQTWGGTAGTQPGQFGLVTDVVQDSRGFYYVAEYGENDRIQKFSPDGKFVLQWGGHGEKPGQFQRPQGLAIDEEDRIWVADACNHRIQVFDAEGRLLFSWGRQGSAPGELSYPYGIDLAPDGSVLVMEYGNHRVQRFTPDGRSLGTWGTQGRQRGQLWNPWGVAVDSSGAVHVLDTNNHRVQRIRF